MAKLKREHVIFGASFDGEQWEALGKDNDDLSYELNPDTETAKNVLGETTVTFSGYEPELDMDPYYADPDRKLFTKLLEISMMEKYAEEDVKGKFAKFYFDEDQKDKESMTGDAYVQDCLIVPQSIGGDTAALGIPFNVMPMGAITKKKVTYKRADNSITVSEVGP